MIRRPDHCGRCAAQDRRRSKEVEEDTGRYGCRSCGHIPDAELAFPYLINRLKSKQGLAIIANWRTQQFENADAHHTFLLLSAAYSGAYTIIGCRTESFKSHYNSQPINFVDVDWPFDHKEVISHETTNTPLDQPVLLFYDSPALMEVVRKRQSLTNQKCIVVTNDSQSAHEWTKIRNVMTIQPDIFRKPQRFWNHERHQGVPSDGE